LGERTLARSDTRAPALDRADTQTSTHARSNDGYIEPSACPLGSKHCDFVLRPFCLISRRVLAAPTTSEGGAATQSAETLLATRTRTCRTQLLLPSVASATRRIDDEQIDSILESQTNFPKRQTLKRSVRQSVGTGFLLSASRRSASWDYLVIPQTLEHSMPDHIGPTQRHGSITDHKQERQGLKCSENHCVGAVFLLSKSR